MELTLKREVLADAVSWSSRTIAQHPAVPVLAGVRIEAQDGQVEFSSFDFEVSSRVRVEAESIVDPAVVVVDGKLLSEITRMLSADATNVVFKTIDNRLQISCGSFKTELLIMPAGDYPALPEFPTVLGSVDAAELAHSVSQVAVAASRDDTMPLLTGVSLEIRPDKLSILATDRYRMALKEIPWQAQDSSVEQNLVVKAKNLLDAAKNIASAGQIEIATQLGDNAASLIGLSSGGRVFTSQINDGTYPDVRRLFPEPINITAVVNVAQFIQAARRVAIVTTNQSNQQIFLKFTQGHLEFRAGSGGENSSQDSIPATLNGADIEVSFNSRMLLEGLASLDEPFVRLSFKDETKPVVITGQAKENGEDNQALRYLIMPIRTSL